MSKKKWIVGIGVVLTAAITVVLYTQSQPRTVQQPEQMMASNSLRFEVVREDLVSNVEVKGKSSYKKETFVNAPFGADVTNWSVSEGQQVRKGDVLFQLDETELRNEIASLQSSIKRSETDLKLADFQAANTASLNEGLSEAESKERYVKAESDKMKQEATRLELNHSRTQLTQKTEKLQSAAFRAAEDGIFLFEDVKQPQSVKENERIGRIVDLTQLQLIAYVGEYDLFRIKEGMPVEIKIDALRDVTLQGTVERLSKFAKGVDTSSGNASASNSTAQFEVVISLEPYEELIAGLGLTATIMTEKKEGVLVIPTLTIQREDGEYYVMVDKNGVPERRTVKIGLETPDKTEIVEGLQEGETVIIQ